MKLFLLLVFAFILVAMLAITITASLDRSVFNVGQELLSDRWFQATLLDAYFGFLVFYLWVAYKERTTTSRIVWFVLIMAFGNIAMSIYALLQLAKLPSGAPIEQLLLREAVPQR